MSIYIFRYSYIYCFAIPAVFIIGLCLNLEGKINKKITPIRSSQSTKGQNINNFLMIKIYYIKKYSQIEEYGQ
jgi:hypothetical protein